VVSTHSNPPCWSKKKGVSLSCMTVEGSYQRRGDSPLARGQAVSPSGQLTCDSSDGTVAPLAELAGRTVMTTRARPRTLRGAKNADAAAVDHVRCDAVAGEGAVAVRGQGVRRRARADRQALAGGAVGVESAVADANALAGSARRRGIRVGALADVRAKSVRRIQDGTDVSTRTVGQACSEPPMVMMGSIARALTQAQMRTRPRRLVLTPTVAS
jgi:hypothetical protein